MAALSDPPSWRRVTSMAQVQQLPQLPETVLKSVKRMCQMVTVSRARIVTVYSSMKRKLSSIKLKRIYSLNYHLLRLIHILGTRQRHFNAWRQLYDDIIMNLQSII